jgi:hypothetical protein
MSNADKPGPATPSASSDLDALENLLRGATDPPWSWEATGEKDNSWCLGVECDGEVVSWVAQSGSTENIGDARLIVGAVNALPALIAELRTLRRERMGHVPPAEKPCPCCDGTCFETTRWECTTCRRQFPFERQRTEHASDNRYRKVLEDIRTVAREVFKYEEIERIIDSVLSETREPFKAFASRLPVPGSSVLASSEGPEPPKVTATDDKVRNLDQIHAPLPEESEVVDLGPLFSAGCSMGRDAALEEAAKVCESAAKRVQFNQEAFELAAECAIEIRRLRTASAKPASGGTER